MPLIQLRKMEKKSNLMLGRGEEKRGGGIHKNFRQTRQGWGFGSGDFWPAGSGTFLIGSDSYL